MPVSDCWTCHVASAGAAPGFRNVSTRASRYWAVATAPKSSGPAATPRARKCPIFAPAVNITLPASSATSNAIERCGSRKIRPVTGTRMTTNGNTPFWNSRSCSPFLAASMAHHTTTANFASSEGCSVSTPRLTQRRAPLIVGVMGCVKGSSGIISNNAVTQSSGHAQPRQR